VTSVLQ